MRHSPAGTRVETCRGRKERQPCRRHFPPKAGDLRWTPLAAPAKGAGPAALLPQAMGGSVQEPHLCSHTWSDPSHIKSEMASLQHQGHRKRISLSCSRERGQIHSPMPGLCSGASWHFFILFLPPLHTQHTENGRALTTGTNSPLGYATCTTPWKKGGEMFKGTITSSDMRGGM